MTKITYELLLTAFVLLFGFLKQNEGYAQSTEKCAIKSITIAERSKNPLLYDLNRAQVEEFTQNYIEKNLQSRGINSTITIPTVVHIMHNGEAAGTYPNISDAQILSAISNLNDAFKNQAIYAGSAFYNSPMDIEFVLAKVKVDGSATTGIERHNVTGKSYAAAYNTNGLNGDLTTGAPAAALFGDYYWNPQDYMNIWIVKKIDGVDTGSGASGTLGYASFPRSFPGASDGLVCQARAFGYNPAYSAANMGATPGFDFGTSPAPSSGNGTADHEVGHYFNLEHTFIGDDQGGAPGTICPLNLVVGTNSDGCADIAPHKRTNSVCPADSMTANTCVAGGGPNNYIHNFMNYSSDACFTGFSEDQRTRVYAALNGPRGAFKTAIGHQIAAANYPIVATTAPVCTNQTNSVLGIFEVSLNGTIYKSSNALHDGGYINRVASQPTITLNANTAYTMAVKVGVGNTADDELLDAYIDYNNDGAFNNTSERIFQSAAGTGKKNGAEFNVTFTTPTVGAFTANQKLRMRLISGFDNAVATIANSFTSDYGNIEDYSVAISTTLKSNNFDVDAKKLNVYPNPTSNILNIYNETTVELVTISLFDVVGKQVYKGLNVSQIDVNLLENGIYIAKFTFENGAVLNKKFTKN